MQYHRSSFFFPSRRRHTRSLCDWSSDVCSSDLQPGHVHRLVERADVHRAVAEVADGDALALLVAQRVRGAGGEGEVAADDAVAAVKAVLDVEIGRASWRERVERAVVAGSARYTR